GRGGFGVITLRVTDKTGNLVSLSPVQGGEEMFVLSEGGVLIRTNETQVSTYARSSQGVNVMRLDEGDRVVSASVMLAEEQVTQVLIEKEAEAEES
ncbi:MAG TPA: DNA gyrase C-terminal beta-propeller domain-containing protein, partial [Deinococcales bacterium]|nr:DNA gyrase C-terminal beta-propeller domain-containing protein [Deinococcales bacterium]